MLLDDFQPAVIGLDLSGSIKDIEERLLPAKAHHKEIRIVHPGLADFDVERSILRNWPREPGSYGKPGRYGLYWWQHFLLFMKELMPETIITPAFVDMTIATEAMLEEGADMVNLIGSKSSGKSAFEARSALTFMAIDPDFTRVYVACPFKNVADFTIWSEIESCYDQIKEHHNGVFPEMKKNTSGQKTLYFSLAHPKGGRVDLVGIDDVAKLQGTKSRDQLRGMMILLGDEIALFKRQDFIEILDNTTGNKNFICYTGCNFKSIIKMDGVLCNPRKGEYADLQPDTDHFWRSAYNSMTLRIDGHLSPNVVNPEKREIYPFLLNETKRVNMETQHGQKGSKYLEQIRSFPHHGNEDDFVLSLSAIRSGGGFDKFYRPEGQWTRLAALDPGFQGDPCKIGAFEFGPAMVQAHDGTSHRAIIFRPVGAIETIKVEVGMVADEAFLARLHEQSDGPVMIKEGREATMDLQIAVAAGEFLRRKKVDRQNFAFDSSCRGSITMEIRGVLGPRVKCYDLVNLPTEMVVNTEGATAKDSYRNLRSENYFTLALIVGSGMLREADLIMDALGQACRHRVVQAGMKVAIESKIDYKKVNQGKSPDASDVLAMACHLARRVGMDLPFNRKVRTNTFSSTEEGFSIRPRPRVAKLTSR